MPSIITDYRFLQPHLMGKTQTKKLFGRDIITPFQQVGKDTIHFSGENLPEKPFQWKGAKPWIQQTLEANMANGLDLKDPQGDGPWFVDDAIKNFEHQTLQFLLAHGVSPDGCFKTNDLPLVTALKKNNTAAFQALVGAGASMNVPDKATGNTFLHYVIKYVPALFPWAMEQGADPEIPDKGGNRALHWSILSDRKDIFDALMDSDLDFQAPNEAGKTPLALAISKKNQHVIQTLMEKIGSGSASNASPLSDTGQPHFKESAALFSAAWMGDLQSVKALLDFLPKLNTPDVNGMTLLHIAAERNDLPMVSYLLSKTTDTKGLLEAVNQQGQTPLYAAIKGASLGIVNQLLEEGASPQLFDKEGHSPLYYALEQGLEPISQKLIAYGADSRNLQQFDSLQAGPLLEELLILRKSKSWNLLKGLGHQPTPFMTAISQWIQRHEVNKIPINSEDDSLGLLSCMPKLLLEHSLSDASFLLGQMESFFDRQPNNPIRYHPNEAELLLLLNHPDAVSRQENILRPLTTALTSITRFIETSTPLTDATVKAWGDIGLLTHAFRFWRYDALSTPTPEGGTTTLLESFGFKAMPTQRPFNDVFGKGFLFIEPKTNVLIEFRRGYLLISQKDMGTLVIRNSSPVFGRDLLKHPAYFMPQALTENEILKFDPRTLPESQHILNKSLYDTPGNDQKIFTLTSGLIALKEDYRKFKFDTEAFSTETNHQKQFTGHLSPGLPHLVQFLNRLQAQHKPLPDLAFAHPHLPIYQTFPFSEDAMGNPVHRFKMIPSHLKELNDFVKGTWRESQYPNSTWLEFIHKAGVETRGELVMLEPEADSSVT
jgi:ankyrin repeat protein